MLYCTSRKFPPTQAILHALARDRDNAPSDPPARFSTDDKMLKRAGLDYWKHVNIVYYDSLEEFFFARKPVLEYCRYVLNECATVQL